MKEKSWGGLHHVLRCCCLLCRMPNASPLFYVCVSSGRTVEYGWAGMAHLFVFPICFSFVSHLSHVSQFNEVALMEISLIKLALWYWKGCIGLQHFVIQDCILLVRRCSAIMNPVVIYSCPLPLLSVLWLLFIVLPDRQRSALPQSVSSFRALPCIEYQQLYSISPKDGNSFYTYIVERLLLLKPLEIYCKPMCMT